MNHAAAWLVWVGAVLILLSTTRNPWYVGLVLAAIALVRTAVRTTTVRAAPIPVSVVKFGLVVVSFSALFNALTVHFGRTVLFSLPDLIPFFGGRVTLEALVYGAVNGLILTGLFAAFTLFNEAVTIRELIRLVPRAFFPVAVITSIAVTFVPVTLRQYHDIRQAQLVRGHRLRGWRDWLPLVIPLLIGGLERALQMAEAMTARGFAAQDHRRGDTRLKLAILVGLGLLLAGWLLRLVWGLAWPGLAILVSGIGLIGGVLWLEGRRLPRTSYRPQPWTGRDWLVAAGAGLSVLAFTVSWPGLERASIFFYPYPRLYWPGFDIWLGLALTGLLGPALAALRLAAPRLAPFDTPEVGKEYDSV